MKSLIAAALLLTSSSAWAWEKAYDGTGVERITDKGGKLWTLPGLSSSTDRGASWSAGYDGDGTRDSDVSDDGRVATVLPKNYFEVTTLDDEESLPEDAPPIMARGVRFLGRSILALGFIRESPGEKDAALLSHDGGATWTAALEDNLGHSQTLFVLDDKRAWIAVSEGTTAVWRTTNGGKDWDRSEYSTPLFGECDELFFLDKKRGWASIGSGAARTIYATDNGGDEWETRGAITLSTAGAASLAFADKKRGWAAAPGAFWETADGGKTWTSRPAPASAVLPEAVALRYVEGRGGGRLLYGTSRSENIPEDDEENVTGRETRSRGEIWKLEAAAP